MTRREMLTVTIGAPVLALVPGTKTKGKTGRVVAVDQFGPGAWCTRCDRRVDRTYRRAGQGPVLCWDCYRECPTCARCGVLTTEWYVTPVGPYGNGNCRPRFVCPECHQVWLTGRERLEEHGWRPWPRKTDDEG